MAKAVIVTCAVAGAGVLAWIEPGYGVCFGAGLIAGAAIIHGERGWLR